MNKCTNRKKSCYPCSVQCADCKCGNCVKNICFSSSLLCLRWSHSIIGFSFNARRDSVWRAKARKKTSKSLQKRCRSVEHCRRSPPTASQYLMPNEWEMWREWDRNYCIFSPHFHASTIAARCYAIFAIFSLFSLRWKKIWNCLNSISSFWADHNREESIYQRCERLVCQDFSSYWDSRSYRRENRDSRGM